MMNSRHRLLLLSASTTWFYTAALLASMLLPGAAQAQEEAADPAGTWKWSTSFRPGFNVESEMHLQWREGKLTGVYSSRGRETPVSNAEFKDGELSLLVAIQRGDGGAFEIHYSGRVSGNTIKGIVKTDFGPSPNEREWIAQRVQEAPVQPADLAGLWSWQFESVAGQSFRPRVKFVQNGKQLEGVVIWGQSETPVSELQVNGKELAFKVIRERQGEKLVSTYTGKQEGDVLIGTHESSYAGQVQSSEWKAARIAE